MTDEQDMTVKDIYEALGVSRWAVQRAISKGELHAIKVKGHAGGRGGTWLIPAAAYRAWVTDHKIDAVEGRETQQ